MKRAVIAAIHEGCRQNRRFAEQDADGVKRKWDQWIRTGGARHRLSAHLHARDGDDVPLEALESRVVPGYRQFIHRPACAMAVRESYCQY